MRAQAMGPKAVGHFAYCLINIGLLGISTFLDRRVFAVFRSLGVAGYLSYLAFTPFKDSLAPTQRKAAVDAY